MRRFYQHYLSFTALYGAIHHGVHSPTHSTYRRPNGERTRQPVLLTHHLLNIVVGGVTGPVIWPIGAYQDLTKIECALRGKDPANYCTVFEVEE